MAGRSRSAEVIIDLGLSSLKLRHGGRGLELPIQRGPDGRVRPDCRGEVGRSIRHFIEDGRGPLKARKRRRAVCGIPSRGVSLRSLELPAVSRDETESLLSFQIEREFPLPLEELAFGYRTSVELNGAGPPRGGTTQDVLVAALRRDALEEYASMFAECGVDASFALGSLAAFQICSLGAGHACVLDIGRTHSELVDLVDGTPRSVRCLPWSGETVTRAIAESLGVDRDRAEEIKLELATGGASEPSPKGSWGSLDATRRTQAVEAAVRDLVRELEECWRTNASGNGAGAPSELVLVGGGSRLAGLPDLIERGLGGSIRCRRVDVAADVAVSAVTEGLQRQAQASNRGALLRLDAARSTPEEKSGRSGRLAVAGWLLAVVALVLASFGLRFAPPLLGEADLDARIAERRTQLAAQPSVDLELNFLKMVQSNQTPYLEVLAAVASSAPPGSFVSEVTMTRRGDALLRGRIGNAAQLEEFRKKLSLSGWFERVVVQERTPQKKHMDFSLLTQFRSRTAASPPAPKPTEGATTDDESKPASKPPSGSGPAAEPPPAEKPSEAAASGKTLTTSEGTPAPAEGSDGGTAKGAEGPPGAKESGTAETTSEAKSTPDASPKDAVPASAEAAATNATEKTTGEATQPTPEETKTTSGTTPQ